MTTPKTCIALFCLAMLCLAALTPVASLLLWAIVLPLCYFIALAVTIFFVEDAERRTIFSGFCPQLPARAPPAVS